MDLNIRYIGFYYSSKYKLKGKTNNTLDNKDGANTEMTKLKENTNTEPLIDYKAYEEMKKMGLEKQKSNKVYKT